ncbi:MAG: hypothetical protein H6559_38510 [Lewinellaceae bacterium]|nr:hypothetical protein [Lewinellaceae bacterium]MCB9298972.1 hypothetical protein [Lewinellaceae bacterium]
MKPTDEPGLSALGSEGWQVVFHSRQNRRRMAAGAMAGGGAVIARRFLFRLALAAVIPAL